MRASKQLGKTVLFTISYFVSGPNQEAYIGVNSVWLEDGDNYIPSGKIMSETRLSYLWKTFKNTELSSASLSSHHVIRV